MGWKQSTVQRNPERWETDKPKWGNRWDERMDRGLYLKKMVAKKFMILTLRFQELVKWGEKTHKLFSTSQLKCPKSYWRKDKTTTKD